MLEKFLALRGMTNSGGSSGGGTGGSGGADWNASEGEPGYVENRPFWRVVKKEQSIPGLPILTITTMDSEDGFIGFGPLRVVPDTKNYVVFDGVEYECEPYFSSKEGAFAIGSIDLVDYPFFISEGIIITKTNGDHTVQQYFDAHEVVADYSPCLIVNTEKTSDGKLCLNMEDVEKIQNAYKNGIPIRVDTSFGGLGVDMQVSQVTNYFIYVVGHVDYTAKCLSTVLYMFTTSDGSLQDQRISTMGDIVDDVSSNHFPVMYINNKRYKITVGDSGNLVATEIT